MHVDAFSAQHTVTQVRLERPEHNEIVAPHPNPPISTILAQRRPCTPRRRIAWHLVFSGDQLMLFIGTEPVARRSERSASSRGDMTRN
jgi:hypothetical protein